MPVGCILTLLGLGGFLCNLARLAPHASVLPQLVAVALGIALLREAVKGKAPETAAPDEGDEEATPPKPSPLAVILAKFAFLDPTESGLGLAALVLGILHIVAGGFPLI